LQRAIGFHHAAGGGEPVAGELVVFGEAGELVPAVIDGIDLGLVGAV
jgi:hypothetical protein